MLKGSRTLQSNLVVKHEYNREDIAVGKLDITMATITFDQLNGVISVLFTYWTCEGC